MLEFTNQLPTTTGKFCCGANASAPATPPPSSSCVLECSLDWVEPVPLLCVLPELDEVLDGCDSELEMLCVPLLVAWVDAIYK